MSIKTFYRQKSAQHCFLNGAISQIENNNPKIADIPVVIIGPPIGGEGSDVESESEEILYATGMPNEIAGEMDVFQGNSKKVMPDSDYKVQGSSESTAKKVKQQF